MDAAFKLGTAPYSQGGRGICHALSSATKETYFKEAEEKAFITKREALL